MNSLCSREDEMIKGRDLEYLKKNAVLIKIIILKKVLMIITVMIIKSQWK